MVLAYPPINLSKNLGLARGQVELNQGTWAPPMVYGHLIELNQGTCPRGLRGLSGEEGFYEILGVEGLEVVDMLTHTNEFHRNVQLGFYGHDDTAFCRSVQLR